MMEWQVAAGSRTAHVLDTEQDGWHYPDGRRKRSGSVCGRNAEYPWFAMSVTEDRVNHDDRPAIRKDMAAIDRESDAA